MNVCLIGEDFCFVSGVVGLIGKGVGLAGEDVRLVWENLGRSKLCWRGYQVGLGGFGVGEDWG